MPAQPTQHNTTVKVTVIFPISVEGPFHAEESRGATVGEVRQAAIAHFKVSQDPEHDYYLTHAGKRVADDTLVGDVAEEREAVKFTLVKELIQGLQ
jgi:hypothetical protein